MDLSFMFFVEMWDQVGHQKTEINVKTEPLTEITIITSNMYIFSFSIFLFSFHNVSLMAWREAAAVPEPHLKHCHGDTFRRTETHRFSKARVEPEMQPFVRSATSIKELVCMHAARRGCSAVGAEARYTKQKELLIYKSVQRMECIMQ